MFKSFVVLFGVRPCSGESVERTEGQWERGVTKWRDLLDWKIGCPDDDCDGGESFFEAKHPASFGFLCVTDMKDDREYVCSGRRQPARVRCSGTASFWSCDMEVTVCKRCVGACVASWFAVTSCNACTCLEILWRSVCRTSSATRVRWVWRTVLPLAPR